MIMSCDAGKGRVSCSVVMALCLCREVLNHSESGGLCRAVRKSATQPSLKSFGWDFFSPHIKSNSEMHPKNLQGLI